MNMGWGRKDAPFFVDGLSLAEVHGLDVELWLHIVVQTHFPRDAPHFVQNYFSVTHRLTYSNTS
jgi:hypothetical protein